MLRGSPKYEYPSSSSAAPSGVGFFRFVDAAAAAAPPPPPAGGDAAGPLSTVSSGISCSSVLIVFKYDCSTLRMRAPWRCFDVKQNDIDVSLMMYPIPKPSGTTGPKPNRRSDGLPQFDVPGGTTKENKQKKSKQNKEEQQWTKGRAS